MGFVFSQTDANRKNGILDIKLGYSVIQHLEPQIYGNAALTLVGDVKDGSLSGFETMNGANLKIYKFFKNNLGVYADFGAGNSSNTVNFQNPDEPFVQYQNNADFINTSIGVAAKLSSESLPASLILGTNIGYFRYEADYSVLQGDNGLWFGGIFQTLKAGMEATIEYEIFKGFNVFSEINYSSQVAVDGDNFNLDNAGDDATYFQTSYISPSMAALRMTFGIGYNF
jgi:hypothetical protein